MIHAEITEHEYVMNDSSHDLKTRRPAIDATLQGDKVIEENKGWGDGTGGQVMTDDVYTFQRCETCCTRRDTFFKSSGTIL